MHTDPPFLPTSDELHAWVDGQLPSDRAQAVADWLQHHPIEAEQVAAWRDQRLGLQALGKSVLDEPVPSLMQRAVLPARPAWPWLQSLAACLLLALGFAGGWSLHPTATQFASAPATSPVSVREAIAAHAVYVPEKRHAVEVGALEQEHLIQWLSKRLGKPLKAPVLSDEGFSLVGGRLLAGESGQPRALFMYETTSGERITLHVSALPDSESAVAPLPANLSPNPGQTAFQFTRVNGIETFYWIEGPFGYALSGKLARAQMAMLADRIYPQLSP